ncbi:MAG: hypothetical protein NZT61_00640 [Deltaproteobacteria bacterium]|nr:hypothetical protein [Deltaproteobacteria bacterium]
MEIASGIILGLVEGFTEFIPVSSTAHLILVSKLLGLKNEILIVNSIVVQAASVLALIFFFWKQDEKLSNFLKKKFLSQSLLCVLIFVVLALLFEEIIKIYLFSLKGIVAGLVLGTLLLIGGVLSQTKSSNFGTITAIFIGFVQSLALIPGVSRSGAVIAAALMCGMHLREAVKFSFFQALILLSAAAFYECCKSFSVIQDNLVLVLSSFSSALFSSYLALGILYSLPNKRFFYIFIGYRIFLIIFLVNFL